MPETTNSNGKLRRRSLLKGLGALALSPVLLGLGEKMGFASSPVNKKINSSLAGKYNTRLVLLGTTGGMTWWPGCDRASASQVLVVGDALYIIDLGFGSTARLAKALNHGKFAVIDGEKTQLDLSTFLNKTRAVFITHMHMDHLGDYSTFLEIGAKAGFGVPKPLPIIGPGDRGKLDENVTGYSGTIIKAVDCDPAKTTATPGLKRTTDLILQAFAQNFNDCALDVGYPDLTKVIDVREIGDPATIPWPAGFTPPDPAKRWTADVTCPPMEPFEVYKDDLVRVTAILVDHYQVYPSFAFRFDTPDGSLVISGDTGANTRGNMQKLAKNADVLVHEVLDKVWVDTAFKGVKEGDPAWPLYVHALQAHTTIEEVGPVAEKCGAKQLVLSHIGPGNTPISRLKKARKGFSGQFVIGEDLMEIGVGKKRA